MFASLKDQHKNRAILPDSPLDELHCYLILFDAVCAWLNNGFFNGISLHSIHCKGCCWNAISICRNIFSILAVMMTRYMRKWIKMDKRSSSIIIPICCTHRSRKCQSTISQNHRKLLVPWWSYSWSWQQYGAANKN